MDNESDLDWWRRAALRPAYVDPAPDDDGVVFADEQAHTIPQSEAAAWVREYFGLLAESQDEPARGDDAIAVLAAYQSHLTPLCQLAGVIEVGANLLRLGRAALASVAEALPGGEPLVVQPWLLQLTAMRRPDVEADCDEFEGTPRDLWTGLCDYARCDPDSPACEFSTDDATLTLAGLFTAAANSDAVALALLFTDELVWPRVSAVMMRSLALLVWAVGHMFAEPTFSPAQVITASANGTGSTLDVAEVLRQRRPELDLDRLLAER